VTPNDKAPLIAALDPLVRRVRTDVTAIKKQGGGQVWTQEPLTPERLARHLNGGPARGVSPIKAGESVTLVALLDFDSHRGEVPWGEMAATAARVMAALGLAWGANPLAFRSSGGAGVHLIMVWDEPQDARAVRQWLAGVLAGCDLRPGTGGVRAGEVEVFPRQDRVRVGGYGNQFILPLAGRSEWLEYDDLADTLGPAAGPLQPEAWQGSAPVPAAGPVREVAAAEHDASDGEGGVPLADWDSLVWAPLEAIANGRGPRGELGAGEGLDYDAWLRVCYAVHWATAGDPGAMARLEEWCARSAKYVPGYLEAKVWGPASAAGRRAGAGDRVTTVETLWVEARRHGWVDAREVDAFPVLDRAGAVPATGGGEAGERPPPERRGVPLAKHLTTDQANANRLVKSFGDRVLVAAGRWHTWDGSRWLADEADLYRYACRLSEIVKAEAKAWRKRVPAAAEGDEG
jgi:hypothetical protein